MIAQHFGHALPALRLKRVKEVSHVARVVSGFGHNPRSFKIGLFFGGAPVFQKEHVRAEPADGLYGLAQIGIIAAPRNAPQNTQPRLRQSRFRRLIGAMTQGYVRNLVRHHARQFALVAGGRNRAGVNEQISAGQGERVDLARRDDSKLIWESFAGGFRRQLRAELFDVALDLRVVEHRRLGQNLLSRLAAYLNVLLRAEEIEAGLETRLRMRTRRRLHPALPRLATIQLSDEQRNRQQRQCYSASDHTWGLLERRVGNGEWAVGRGKNASLSDSFFFPIPHSQLPTPHLLLLHELQRDRIDAVAQPGRPRPVIEDVAEMRAAAAARHFDAAHAVTIIGFGLNILFRHRLPEAGPARARIEFGFRAIEFLRAAGAYVAALLVIIPVFPGEGALGSLLAHHLELHRRQYLRPFFVGLDDLFDLLRLHLLSVLPFRFRWLVRRLRETIRADQ